MNQRGLMILFALLVGLVSLGLQFVFNRLIFFYLVNTDYATVSVICLHLTGFLVGALLAKRYVISTGEKPSAIAVSSFYLLPVVTALSYTLSWRYGMDIMPVTALLAVLGISAFTVAFLGGFIIAVLMATRPNSQQSTLILIADTAGSVIGALLVGFLLLPHFGITTSFLLFIGLTSFITLLTIRTFPFKTLICLALTLIILALPFAFSVSNKQLRAEGLALPYYLTEMDDDIEIVDSIQSPLGILSVTRIGPAKILRIDNIELCIADTYSGATETSEYEIGRFPSAFISQQKKPAPKIAIVGLGCGFTLAAALKELPSDANVTLIEVNADMPRMTRHFSEFNNNALDDPRLNLKIKDGFKYFMQGNTAPETYDAVIVDITWMRDATLTHLFSKEFFEAISLTLKKDGIFALWEEGAGISYSISQTIYATLQSVFPYVGFRHVSDSSIYFASNNNSFLSELPEEAILLTEQLRMKSAGAPLNTLDNLVLNRLIFGFNAPNYNLNLYEKIEQKDKPQPYTLDPSTQTKITD